MSLGSREDAYGRSGTEDVGLVSVLSTQILRLGLGCRWFIQEAILRSTSEGIESEIEERKVNKGCVHEQVTAKGPWGSILLSFL